MKKIPTLYVRNPDDRKHVIVGEVTPGCEWVVAGEGLATRKWDGTCVRISHHAPDAHGVDIYVRHTLKRGQEPPPAFQAEEYDDVTGKTVGWMPYSGSGWARYIEEAIGSDDSLEAWPAGTYELIGPKVNGNPDQVPNHRLERHGNVKAELGRVDLWGHEHLAGEVAWLGQILGWEGVVWHHLDGRMAKLKARDLFLTETDSGRRIDP